MKKDEIIKELKKQYSDEFTIKILNKFIEDFQNCFGEYLPTEEVIQRLKERVSNIVVVDKLINGKLDGRYNDETKTVTLYKDVLKDDQYCSYLIFHELLHAITTKDLPDSRRMFGFYDLSVKNGNCFNEAMTEWLTKIRNEKEGINYSSGYDAISQQISILSQIIGNKKLLNTFLYEPENIRNLLNEYNIDFDEIEQVFRLLIQKESDIRHLGNRQKLNDLNNVKLYEKCERLFDIFSNAIGKVDSLEKFKNKYKILNTYKNENLNLNKLIEVHYYSYMYADLRSVVKSGATQDEINDVLAELGLSFRTIKNYSFINEIFSKNKNETAIELYRLFSQNPNEYYNFAFQNYCYLFNKFSGTDLLPNENSLYDMEKYPMIGKFLAEHKNYEYDEIATKQFATNNGILVYSFKTSDNKLFLYTLPNYPVEIVGDNKFKINFEKGNITLNFQDGVSFESHTEEKEPVVIKNVYSEYSQLDDIEYCIEDLDGISDEERSKYKMKYETIKSKIQDNRNKMIK